MSKHNYSQYSNKKNNKPKSYDRIETEEFVTTVEAPEEPVKIKMEHVPVVEPVLVNETVETVTLPKSVSGTLSNCSKLNVRSKPAIDADVLVVLDVNSEIAIDPARSTNEWVKVTTAAGVEGYCMRKFVSAKA